MNDFLKAFAQPKSRDLLSFISERIKSVEVVPPMKDGDRVRASSIRAFCPRYEAIRVEHDITTKRFVSPKLERIFTAGRAFERYLRDTILAPAGVLVGAWSCMRCTNHSGNTNPRLAEPRPHQCPACGEPGDVMTYVEPFGMADPEHSDLGGSGDGFIRWEGETSLLEVKTANDERFRKVSRARWPFPEYHDQAQVYMKVFGLAKTFFWFHNKDKSDELGIWVPASQIALAPLLAKAEALRRYFRQNQFPNRICSTPECPRARSCPLAGPCFEQSWPELDRGPTS